MTAGIATLKLLEDGSLINQLNMLGQEIRRRLKEIFENNSLDVQVTGASSLFNVHFTKQEVKDANVASKANREKLMEYHLHLITNGVFFLPTHVGALSTSHLKEDIDKLFWETEKYAECH
jgi:glutamate-1-semialdehyde aminotransferase